MPTYAVAGLRLITEHPLAELSEIAEGAEGADATPGPPGEGVDWRIVLADRLPTLGSLTTLSDTPSADGGVWSRHSATSTGGYLVDFPGQVAFAVDPAERTVVVVAEPGLAENTRTHFLVDQLVPHLASLHGGLVLHASAVVAGGRALALIGASGSGKSSLAAGFVQRGDRLLCDDYLHLHRRGAQYLATPSYPGLRLWEDSAAHFAGRADDLPRVADFTQKRRWAVAGADADGGPPVPLAAIVVLGRDPGPDAPDCRIGRLRGKDAFILVYRQTFRLGPADRDRLESDLDGVLHLSESVPVLLLEHRRTYDGVPHVLSEIDRVVAKVTG